MVSFLALKEHRERRVSLALLVSLALEDRKDGKVILGTVNAQTISTSHLFRGRQDRRASQASVGRRDTKGSKETLATTASLGSPGSRESLVTLDLLDPKE